MSDHPFGLREHPFVAGRDPRFTYASPGYLETLARLENGLRDGEPFLQVTGESGVGKTTAVTGALAACGPQASVALLANPSLTRLELLESISMHFGATLRPPLSKPRILARLERRLADIRSRGGLAVLVLDEAHGLDPELLEEIRLLSNLEADGRGLLSVVFVGLPEFENQLEGPGLEPLAQRVAVRLRLHPLSAEEAEAYVHHRVAAAGGNAPDLFPRATCVELHRLGAGIPRDINALASEAMMRAHRDSASCVTPDHVRAGGRELRRGRATAPPEPAPIAAVASEPIPESRRQEPEVREWVSRFVGAEGPPRIGVRAGLGSETFLDEHDTLESNDEMSAIEMQPLPRSQVLPPGARRFRRRRGTTHTLRITIAAALVAALALAAILAGRAGKSAPHPVDASRVEVPGGAAAPGAAATPAAGPGVATPAAPGPSAAATLAPAPLAAAIPVSLQPARIDSLGPSPASAPPARHYGVEVSVYINPERAVAERERLTTQTGLPARMLTGTENGAAVYRIVLGWFASQRAAERAADDLVRRGVVDQARLVALGDS